MEKCFILYNFGKIIIAYWNLKDFKVHIKWLIWIIGGFDSFYKTTISQGNCQVYEYFQWWEMYHFLCLILFNLEH